MSLSKEEFEEERRKYCASIENVLRRKSSGIRENEIKTELEPTFTKINTDLIAYDKKELLISRRDSKMFDSSSILCKQGADFNSIGKLFMEHVVKPQKDLKAGGTKRSRVEITDAVRPVTAKANSESKNLSRDNPDLAAKNKSRNSVDGRPTGPPIIIVPNSMVGAISSYNAVDFLEHSQYISIEEKKAMNAKKDADRVINRVLPNGKLTRYRLIHDPRNLRPEEWDLVIAVFAMGELWQFINWKWSDPVDLFQRVLGFHLTLDDRPVNPQVLNWNCRVLKSHMLGYIRYDWFNLTYEHTLDYCALLVNRSKRHLDAGAVNEFWGAVDEHVRLHKAWLLASSDKKEAAGTTSAASSRQKR